MYPERYNLMKSLHQLWTERKESPVDQIAYVVNWMREKYLIEVGGGEKEREVVNILELPEVINDFQKYYDDTNIIYMVRTINLLGNFAKDYREDFEKSLNGTDIPSKLCIMLSCKYKDVVNAILRLISILSLVKDDIVLENLVTNGLLNHLFSIISSEMNTSDTTSIEVLSFVVGSSSIAATEVMQASFLTFCANLERSEKVTSRKKGEILNVLSVIPQNNKSRLIDSILYIVEAAIHSLHGKELEIGCLYLLTSWMINREYADYIMIEKGYVSIVNTFHHSEDVSYVKQAILAIIQYYSVLGTVILDIDYSLLCQRAQDPCNPEIMHLSLEALCACIQSGSDMIEFLFEYDLIGALKKAKINGTFTCKKTVLKAFKYLVEIGKKSHEDDLIRENIVQELVEMLQISDYSTFQNTIGSLTYLLRKSDIAWEQFLESEGIEVIEQLMTSSDQCLKERSERFMNVIIQPRLNQVEKSGT